MNTDNFNIEKNFDFDVFESYSQLNLNPSVQKILSSASFRFPPRLHQHTLPSILTGENCAIASPPATGKSLLLAIALFHFFNPNNKNLQFLIVEGQNHLVDETYKNLKSFNKGLNIKYCVHDDANKTLDFKEFKHCQIAIANLYKTKALLTRSYRTYNSLRFIILDAVNIKKVSFDVMNLLREKAPHAKYWHFTRPDKISNELLELLDRYLGNYYKAIVTKNIYDIKTISHYFMRIENNENVLKTINQLVFHFNSYQKVIYAADKNRVDALCSALKSTDFRSLHPDDTYEVSKHVLKDFKKGVFSILICPIVQIFVRRISVTLPIVLIMEQPVSPSEYCMLCRRSGDIENERVITLVSNNNQDETIEEISQSLSVKFNEWKLNKEN